MPTEEIFTTPHCRQAEGYVRTSKPGFPFERRVDDAFFRFREGEVVEYSAAEGQDVLDQFFQIPGAQRLGEIALVDVRSPVNQSGLLFYETLFDENCVCHMAFGQGYPEGVLHGSTMTDEEKAAHGINLSETHVDFMIGTPTMNVTGIRSDGTLVPIMRHGMFAADQQNGAAAPAAAATDGPA
jgi:aminopeptidase